jgi:transposase
MEKIPKRVYTAEFKNQAAQLVVSEGLGLTEAARRLSISPKTLANWVAAAKHGKRANAGPARKPVTELEAEVARLRRELAEMKMERDLLKKATAYFAKDTR